MLTRYVVVVVVMGSLRWPGLGPGCVEG
jgi:hypothetical protein